MAACTTEGLQLLAVSTEIWNYNVPHTTGNTVGWVKTLAYIDGDEATSSPAPMSLYDYTFTTNPAPLPPHDYTSGVNQVVYSSTQNGLVYENFIVFVCYVSTANASPSSCIGNLNGSTASAFSLNSNESPIIVPDHDLTIDHTGFPGPDFSNSSVIAFDNLAELGPNPQNAYMVFAFPMSSGTATAVVDFTIGSA